MALHLRLKDNYMILYFFIQIETNIGKKNSTVGVKNGLREDALVSKWQHFQDDNGNYLLYI